ncbi:MAG: hypothetical protein Q9194_003718 [Teloschistes cf. exilis]
MTPTRPAKLPRQRNKKSSQSSPWTKDELHRVIDAVARGERYEWIASNEAAHHPGKPLRSAAELREVLQLEGPAHNCFWDMPIYWDFSKAVEDAGEIQDGQDVSPLTNVEEEELVLFHCRGMNIDPNKFKIKRSSAFLAAQLARLRDDPTYLNKIVASNIDEKRSLKAQLEAFGDAATTRMQGARTSSQAQHEIDSDEMCIVTVNGAGQLMNANDTDETERESSSHTPPPELPLDGGAAPEGQSGGQAYETSDDEMEDPPLIVTPRQPAPGHARRVKKQIADFRRRWAQRPPSGLDDDKEDKYFIKHARRWGMSPKQISDSSVLKTGKRDPAAVNHRIHQMLHDGKDVFPRTEKFIWNRHKKTQKIPNTLKEWEAHNLKNAIRNGQTAREIKESGIIAVGKNTVGAIKHRWETYLWQGEKFPTPK